MQVTRSYGPGEPVPERGQEVAALIDRTRPGRYEIAWPQQHPAGLKALWDKEYATRVAAEARLCLKPSVVAEVTSLTIRELATIESERRYGRGLLPDGNQPVSVQEAEQLYVDGVATIGANRSTQPGTTVPGQPRAPTTTRPMTAQKSAGPVPEPLGGMLLELVGIPNQYHVPARGVGTSRDGCQRKR